MMFIHLDLSIIWHPYSPSDPDMSLVPSSCFLSSNSSSMLPDWGNLILAKRCLKDSKKTDKVVQHFFPINNPSLAICNKNTVYVYIHNIVIIKVYIYIVIYISMYIYQYNGPLGTYHEVTPSCIDLSVQYKCIKP